MNIRRRIVKQLVGKKVRFKRLAARDLLLFFFGNPGDNKTVVLWFGQAWRLFRSGELLVGSKDHPLLVHGSSPAQSKREYEAVCALSDCLNNATVQNIHFDSVANDILMNFENDMCLSSFAVNFCNNELFIWRYREFQTNLIVHAQSSILRIMPYEDRSGRSVEFFPRSACKKEVKL